MQMKTATFLLAVLILFGAAGLSQNKTVKRVLASAGAVLLVLGVTGLLG